jgi:hypothetical protein
MEPSTFILEFHAHLQSEQIHAFALAVGTAGASSNWLSETRLELTCVKRSQLQHVGYIIYSTGQPALCNVVGVSGEAKAHASAYKGFSL